MIKKLKRITKRMRFTNCAKCNKPIAKNTANKRVARSGATTSLVCNTPCEHNY